MKVTDKMVMAGLRAGVAERHLQFPMAETVDLKTTAVKTRHMAVARAVIEAFALRAAPKKQSAVRS